jgi:primary-amine oxidase
LRRDARFPRDGRLPVLALEEPGKAEVLAFRTGTPFSRRAFAVVYDPVANRTFEAITDLRLQTVTQWLERPGVQPLLSSADFSLADELVRANGDWRAALAKRAVAAPEDVQIDVWPFGYYSPRDANGGRKVWAVCSLRGTLRNAAARPIEGIAVEVDLSGRRVVRVIDTGIVPIPRGTSEYHSGAGPTPRTAPRPLNIVQPQGGSFQVRGSEVRWQKWRFRFGMQPREGLVLYTVSYEDAGRERSVLYRGALSEMAVPYGDPGPTWYFRNVFDAGETGLGWLAMPLEPDKDAPGNATYFPAAFADEAGNCYDRPRTVALYERDGGLLWKHFDLASGSNESRRSRELVLSTVCTAGNYDYGFNWVFRQDGSLEMETLLTGIMTTRGVARETDAGFPHAEGRHGHLLAQNLEAVHHQHFFNFRLDLDIERPDGNVVSEVDAVPLGPAAENPYGNGFAVKETVLETEKAARRQVNTAAGRRWRISNPGALSALGHPAAYTLVPGENSVPLSLPGSAFRKRAEFVEAHLWVTPFAQDEKYSAGNYPNQSTGGDGILSWTAADRPVKERDVVVWYTMGITHLPRPEDWPVMPVHKAGFKLVPTGFFTRSPALDVP